MPLPSNANFSTPRAGWLAIRAWACNGSCSSLTSTVVITWWQTPEALTQLGWALKFYDISFLYAPTPQAKGKIEREHQFWQKRLPPYFASEELTELDDANTHIDALRLHRNAHETHRELNLTAQCAWDLAKKEKRTVIR